MITTTCKISYGSQTVPPIVPAVQGDTGRAISFEIADFTPPAGATATYFILKPSGEAIYNSATITDNSILCELTAQSLAEAGENRMQVRVLQGEDIVTSFEVILMVRTFLGDDAIESGTEMNIFDQAVEQATEQFQENAKQIVEEVIESIPADYTALTEEVDELNERLGNEIANITDITGSEKIQFTTGYVIATNKSVGQEVSLTPTENSSLSYAVVDCSDGDKFVINGRGWTTGRLWAFIDSNNLLLSVSDASLSASNLIIVAPANSAKCIINSFNNYLGNCFYGLPVPILEGELQNDIASIDDNLLLNYNDFEQGTINSSGVPVSNVSVMRSSECIPLKQVKQITIGKDNYFYLRLYDDYENYLGSIITLGYGASYPSNDVNYETIRTTYPTASNLKLTIHGSSAVTPQNINSIGLVVEYYKTIPNTVIVDVNVSGVYDYTSILRALKETYPTTKVYVKSGNYNIVSEYEEYYGSDFWTNYTGFSGQNDNFLRGLYVSNGRVLEFESGAFLKFDYSGDNASVAQYFSILATGYNATIIGGYLDYGNEIAEYAIHDDNATKPGTNIYKGIIIDGVPSGRGGNHIGGGCGLKNTYILEDIVFLDTSMPDNYGDMYYHNNSNANALNRIFVKNCRGLRSCSFRYFGASNYITYCIASGNSFRAIRLLAHTIDSVNENMALIEYNNTITGQ